MSKKINKFIWYSKDKKIISCDETNKVLNENHSEVQSLIQNAFDDAILMGCDEEDVKGKIINLVNNTVVNISMRVTTLQKNLATQFSNKATF